MLEFATWAALAAAAVLGLLLYRLRREATAQARRLDLALQSLEQLQRAFGRFAPQEVVEQIIARGIVVAGEKKEVTVLFADLKGFTRMSEGLDPAVLVKILNDYFTRMSMAISEYNGHVSKFIGDGIMALFGALESNPWQHNDAVRAALAMRRALEEYNAALRAQELPEMEFGIGIHRGVAIAGVIGNHELMEFTCMGDTVNLASRVEDLTRVHQVDILITEEVRRNLDPQIRLRPLPPVPVKGKSEPVATFAVEGVASQ